MDAVRNLPGVNFNVLGLQTVSLTAGATTQTLTAVATGGIGTISRFGVKAILAAGAKAFAKYTAAGVADSSARTLVATSTTGQAVIMVMCIKNIAGTETLVSVLGNTVDLDVNSAIVDGDVLNFPNITDDTMVPIAYAVVVNPAASSTATFTFGSTNWNATSIVASNIKDVASLPRRPLATVTSVPGV